MKKLSRIILLSISTLLFSYASALPPPKPIKGSASIISKSFSANVGGLFFEFTFPSGWGIGDMDLSAEGRGYFHLYPVNGGVGCSIEISKFENEELAKDALNKNRKTFSSFTKLHDGFEAGLSKAYYACHVNGEYLIQIWYSLPEKKNKKYAKNWQLLKNCMSFFVPNHTPINNEEQKFLPVVQTRFGWTCNHPNNKLHVTFESFPLYTCQANADPSTSYILEFDSFEVSGFFYVKWDQIDLDKREPYQAHLQEMLQDIMKMEPKQQVLQDPEFNLKEGYAILHGDPYYLITLSGDNHEFLVGFAVKIKSPYITFNVSELANRITWQKDF